MFFVFYHLYLLQYTMLKFFYKISLLLLILLAGTLLYQKNTYAYHTLLRINPIPDTKVLIDEKHYADAYEYLNYFMDFEYVQVNEEAKKLLQEIIDKRSSFSYMSEKIAEGIQTGTSDELSGQLSAIGSDFFVIGDIRDLALEGTHYFHDEEVDKVLVSLSTIGLVASASTLFTLGSSAVAKSGVSVLKLAHKSKRIPPWLSKYLIREAKQIQKSKDISSIKPLFHTIDSMQKKVGLTDTLKLLSHTKNFKELKGVSKLVKRYGSETNMLLKLSDKKVLTHTNALKKVDKKTIVFASTYGSAGFAHLIKSGEKNFIKTTKRLKAYSKLGYKGEVWKMFLWLLKHLSDTILIVIMSTVSLLLFPWKKLKSVI